MEKSKESTGSCFAALIALPVVLVITALLNGTVLSIIWGWFVVPVFRAPSLSIAYAIGLGLVVSFLTARSSNGKDERRAVEILFSGLLTIVVNAGVVLGLAFVVHLFV